MDQVHRLPGIHLLGESLAQNIDAGLNYRLKPPNRSFGEEITKGTASSAVERMAHSPKGHISAAKHTGGPRPFLHVLGDGGIELIYEIRVCNVKLVGIDADDRTYLRYQLCRKLNCLSFWTIP